LLFHMDITLMIHVMFIDVSYIMMVALGINRLSVCSATNCTVITERHIPHTSPPNVAVQRATFLFYVRVL
jgi:hypothetical protein